ncbi:hypothetical protein CG723_30970 [Streptomyces sp. CB01635]|uniref:ETEC_3214 domain-containing protein n=1 Tax=unclassified Streptomyces TaxID=2593676 RepID=UPI000C27C6B3|nr:ETEC_3214 domain-containing protein [Streptomyces sp. CB01635]PJN07831.1 hypothetical protein CG723_30970 [Streptomyces sp. CB01635]
MQLVKWIPPVEAKLNLWQIAAIFVACISLYNILRGWWRSTLGRRGFFVRNCRKLAPHVRHEYVKGLFGEPAWQHKQNVEQYSSEQEVPGSTETLEMTVRTWPLGRMGFLVTWCTANDEVEMYSITTRSRIFRPAIRVGGRYLVRLGKSRLSALPYPDVIEDPIQWRIGSRRFSYAETHYFGNPGAYHTWAMGVSDSGHPAAPPVELGSSPEYCNDPVEIPRYRARARINSVLVAGGSAIRLNSLLPDGVGPDHDRVRLADPEYGLRALCTRLRWQTWQAASHMRELVRRGEQ